MGKLRPPKKKTVVVSSDDEDEDEDDEVAPPTARNSNTRGSVQGIEKENGAHSNKTPESKRGRIQKPPANASPSSQKSDKLPSPTKSKSKSKSKVVKPQSKTIYSFFNTTTQRQLTQPSASPEKRHPESINIEEDLIQDDDSFGEELASLGETKFGSQYPVPVRQKRKRDGLEDGLTESSSLPRGSQIFKKVNTGTNSSGSTARAASIDQRPWTEKYGPSNLDELAVHKRKVHDIRIWLESVLAGRDRKRLLILKGSAGTGKTTTIKLLSRELGVRVSEWKNPEASSNSEEGFISMSAHFEDFVARTGRFGVLDIASSETESGPRTFEDNAEQKRLIMIEEFPNTFSRSSSALNSFRSAVTQYLETSTPSMDTMFSRQKGYDKPITPIVMVISETLLSTSTAAADSFTAYRLLGPEILSHPGVTVLEVNPIAPTFMTKALDLIVQKESRQSGRRKAPGPSVLKHLAEIGDIRSAISSLEFLCLRGDEHGDWSGKVTFTKKNRGSEAPLSKMESASLETITQRESTLGIFHAVGKVVYNKRELPSATDTVPPQPPPHLPQFARPKVSEVNIESLLAELGTDIQTFVAAVHENYALSCEGLDLEDTLDHINGCIDALSDADILSPDRFGSSHNRVTLQGTGTDSLRQEELSFQTTVRGLLFNLPNPVKRIAPPPNIRNIGKGLGRGAAHQMFYPVSMRLWRRKDELEELLELLIVKLRDGQFRGDSQDAGFKAAKLTGVEAWRMNRYSGVPTPAARLPNATEKADHSTSPDTLFAGGSSAKSEILLERLPYMAMMAKKRAPFGTSNLYKELEKITKVTTTGGLNGDEEEELETEAESTEQWSTDKPLEETTIKIPKTKFGLTKGSDQAGIVKAKMESLVLEDDDIEDD